MTWIQTYTGKKFYPLDPKIEDICIEDIAHALSMICRFNGHCNRFYSVAEHSIIISDFLPVGENLAGLLHDGAEAYFCDLPRPIKELFPEYKKLENKTQDLIFKKFNIKKTEIIKRYDNSILIDESNLLMPNKPEPWTFYDNLQLSCYGSIQCWSPQKAEFEFLKRFRTLTEV
jgi:hypothetical protein